MTFIDMKPLCEVFTLVLSHFTKVMTLPLTDITICILAKCRQARLNISSISSFGGYMVGFLLLCSYWSRANLWNLIIWKRQLISFWHEHIDFALQYYLLIALPRWMMYYSHFNWNPFSLDTLCQDLLSFHRGPEQGHDFMHCASWQ